MQHDISPRPSFGRLARRNQPPMPRVRSNRLKYIDSLKFSAASTACVYSSSDRGESGRPGVPMPWRALLPHRARNSRALDWTEPSVGRARTSHVARGRRTIPANGRRALMSDAPTSKFPELGFYGLPGHTRTPRDVLRQVQDAEAMGIGNVMISERADYRRSPPSAAPAPRSRNRSSSEPPGPISTLAIR